MAKLDELTVDLVVNPCERVDGGSEKVGTMKPIGKENVAKCIENIGQHIINNAKKIAENIDRTVSIDIDCNISVDELPTVSITYENRLNDTTMFPIAKLNREEIKKEKSATTEQ